MDAKNSLEPDMDLGNLMKTLPAALVLAATSRFPRRPAQKVSPKKSPIPTKLCNMTPNFSCAKLLKISKTVKLVNKP